MPRLPRAPYAAGQAREALVQASADTPCKVVGAAGGLEARGPHPAQSRLASVSRLSDDQKGSGVVGRLAVHF